MGLPFSYRDHADVEYPCAAAMSGRDQPFRCPREDTRAHDPAAPCCSPSKLGAATPDGGAVGRVERDWAQFMTTRHGPDYPPALTALVAHAWKDDGDKVTTGRFPVVDVRDAWDVRSVLEVEVPGVEADFAREGDTRTAVLVHPDGSWARASAHRYAAPTVHQGGPRRLWSALEMFRLRLNAEGALPLYGAHVRITPDGVCHLKRGGWTGVID